MLIFVKGITNGERNIYGERFKEVYFTNIYYLKGYSIK